MRDLRRHLFCLVLSFVALDARSASPPSVDTKAEEQAIRMLDTQWGIAASKKDAEIAVALYAPDTTVLDPDVPAKKGAETMRPMWTEFLKTPGLAINIVPEKIEIATAGDIATDFGRFELEFDGPQGHMKVVHKY